MQITRRQLRRIIREEAARARSKRSLHEAMISAPGYTGLGLPDDAWDPSPDPAIARAVTEAFKASLGDLGSFVEDPTERDYQNWDRNVEAEGAWLAAQVDKLVVQAYTRLFR
jgi:hypothetical protein